MDQNSDAMYTPGHKSKLATNKFYVDEEFDDKDGEQIHCLKNSELLECPESGGLVEFPNGLPNAPSKKQKLSDVDQQLRKAETAKGAGSRQKRQLRKLRLKQSEKYLDKTLIRRRKRSEKNNRKHWLRRSLARLQHLDQIPRSTWNGGYFLRRYGATKPKMLDSMPCRYPPPREKCIGPNCTNDYKYRDSKSKLPLCSLHCYKSVRGNMEVLPAC